MFNFARVIFCAAIAAFATPDVFSAGTDSHGTGATLADIDALTPDASDSEKLAMGQTLRSASAQALAAGVPVLAADLAREALDDRTLSNAARERLLLTLSGAQIAMGDYPSAAATLSRISGTSPAKKLRETFIAIYENRFSDADLLLAEIVPEKLPEREKSWYFIAKAISASFHGKSTEAESDFVRAENFAPAGAAREHVEFVRQWAETIGGNTLDEIALNGLKAARDAARGKPNFETAGKLYAVALAKSGDRAGALAALRETTPIPEKDAADFALLEGLLTHDIGSEKARSAFQRVIAARPPRARQNAAFSGLLFGVRALNSSGKKEEAILAANGIEKFLNTLLPDDHVRDLELFTRARIAFEVGNLRRADALANELILRFPASPFVPDSLRLLIGIARQEKEFRRAIPLLEKLRTVELSESERIHIDILIADCNFLSGDYSLAADAYARATNSSLVNEEALGIVFFQQALSYIRSGNVAKASELLDSPMAERVPAPWTMRTECIVIEALQRAGLFTEASARAEKFLQRGDLLPDFRIRILWIQALLALDLGNPELAMHDADEIAGMVSNFDGDVSVAMRETSDDLMSRIVLLKARAMFLSGADDDALKLLAELRERYPESASAVISWLEEGRRFSELGKPARAMVSYENLIARYGTQEKFSEYAAIACFEAAQAAATIGRPRDAVKQMQTLVSRYPKSPLTFFARMRQADFFRILNDFDSALAVYDNLLAVSPERPEKRAVEMRRADTLLAIATRTDTDGNATAVAADARMKAEAAYERLFSLPDQPLELKAEAGFKWGYAVAQSVPPDGDSEDAARARTRAQGIYWKTATSTLAAAQERGNVPLSAGAYWVARSLFALAESYEKSGDYESARGVYEKIAEWNAEGILPGKDYAERRLKRILEK